ncbi:transcriptional regulator NrdR [Myxococcota bacterium]|nr:transcriptional regulator NrdR [Myxococcota bacterium]
MRCPYCGDDANRVVDSRLGRDEAEIRRRRECLECGRRFTTRERVEDVLPKLVKRDERREDFDRRKLLASIERACAKRPVSIDALERLADRIEKRLQETGQTEVASEQMGEWVLEDLTSVDLLSAARFASVFRSFESAEDYVAFFASARPHRYEAEAGFEGFAADASPTPLVAVQDGSGSEARRRPS